MGETGSEITEKTPEQWVEQYARYRNNLTVDSIGRIIKSDMTNIARTCVSVGFHLKIARDRELYKDAGYGTLWEYAADQFGLSMGSASRYISINDLFSVGGNTPILQEEYRNFSKSQLQEMITLSPEQRKKVTEQTTVRQIREMKEVKKKPIRDAAVDTSDTVVDATHEDIPGQMQVEDYPGVVPEGSVATSQMEKCIPEKAIEYDRRILQDMIADTENSISVMKDYWIENQPYTYAKYFMQLQAFRMLLELHDREEADGEE